ncbi:hypothetical protein, partial [Bacillus mycoides]|uniref:hypothetical protein n=1 Tax=Bacillus mycoides TaxID=1405 RepID=UPI002E22A94C|nr:hypothetical protein [Bacillus mycoides]
SYPSNEYVGGYSIQDGLPQESKQFQKISNMNTRDNHRVLDAQDTYFGQLIDNRVGDTCKYVEHKNSVIYELSRQPVYTPDSQYFIFYQMDNGNFIIANKENSRVLEVIFSSVNGFVTISNEFNATSDQRFKVVRSKNDTFRLVTEGNKTLNICGHSFQYNTKITAVNADIDGDNYLFQKSMDKDTRDLYFGTISNKNPEILNDPRNLKSLDDLGDEPRAFKGAALLPALFVNDPRYSVHRRVSNSPYYYLEYTQYWHRIWTDVLPIDGYGAWIEMIGVTNDTQVNMKNIMNITITGKDLGVDLGIDLGLRFGDKSFLFEQKILSGLSIRKTDYPNLGIDERAMYQRNNSNLKTRFVRYVKKHEFVLRDLNGSKVAEPWIITEDRSITKEYSSN